MFGVPIGRTPAALVWAAYAGGALFSYLVLIQIFASTTRGGQFLSSMIVFPLMMIGGSFFPLEVMPAWMARIGRWTPNGIGVAQLKEILFGHPDPARLAIAAIAIGAPAALALVDRRPPSARPVCGELMSLLQGAWFVATKDVAYLLRRRETILWTFLMPIVFFYFIGTVTGGFGSTADRRTPLAVRGGANGGFLIDELMRRLEAQQYDVVRPDTGRRFAKVGAPPHDSRSAGAARDVHRGRAGRTAADPDVRAQRRSVGR